MRQAPTPCDGAAPKGKSHGPRSTTSVDCKAAPAYPCTHRTRVAPVGSNKHEMHRLDEQSVPHISDGAASGG